MKTIQICIYVFTLALLVTPSVQADTKLSAYDQLKIGVQKTCPVTGRPLGSMGQPLKVKISGEELFLCCQGCTKGQIKKEHWTDIHKNFASAQGICPVMEKPLPANPKSTLVNGQMVYVCCPPCTKKIHAEPKKYLTRLAGYYQSALRNPQHASANSTPADISSTLANLRDVDRLRAAVQEICPVSGNPLGSSGVPQKSRVAEVDVFLCCEGCKQGKINKTHWAKVAANIKASQSKCPVMEKDLPANAKSIVVDGQLVYVCCPPCTKRIAAEPAKYLARVNGYYQSSLAKRVRVVQRTSAIQN